MNLLLVFVGGGIGCVVRYLIGQSVLRTVTSLPLSTFISNVSACLIFALVIWLSGSKGAGNSTVKLFLLTGFCGGLSTFSTFGYETFLLIRQGLMMIAILNMILTTGACLFIFYLFK